VTASSRTLKALFGLVPVAAVFSLLTGEYAMAVTELPAALLSALRMPLDTMPFGSLVLWEIRLPRLLAATLSGAGLGIAGTLLQRLTSNPLASPTLFSVHSGGALGVILLFTLHGSFTAWGLPVAAMTGAALSLALVFVLTWWGFGGLSPVRVVVIGALVSALTSALSTGLLLLSDQSLEQLRFWLAGSLAGVGWQDVLLLLPFCVLGVALTTRLVPRIMVLELGESMARGLGESPVRLRLLTGLAVVLLCAATIAVAGPIAFVGLMVPHLARIGLNESDMGGQVCRSAWLGSLLVILADLASRGVWYGSELPVSVPLALIGAPFFMFLVLRHYRHDD
jgi:iron complex transport system permease protein